MWHGYSGRSCGKANVAKQFIEEGIPIVLIDESALEHEEDLIEALVTSSNFEQETGMGETNNYILQRARFARM